MAGVPSIMLAMLDEVAPKLKISVHMLSETVRADAREGDIGMQLGEIAKANPEVAIGSYPFFRSAARAQHECGATRPRCTEARADQTRGRRHAGARAAERNQIATKPRPLTAKPSLLRKAIMVIYRPTQPEGSTSTRSSQRGRRPTRSIESIPSRRGRPI